MQGYKENRETSRSLYSLNLTFLVDFVLCVALIVAISLLTLSDAKVISNYQNHPPR